MNGPCCSRRLRLTLAKVRIMGAAEGVIMAIIISTHIRNKGRTVDEDQGRRSGPDIFMPAHWQTPVWYMARASCTREPQARAESMARAVTTTTRSRFSTDSRTVLWLLIGTSRKTNPHVLRTFLLTE